LSFTNPLPNTTNFASIAWSPELGMLVAFAAAPATNNEKALYIRLKNRLPTSYNVFDSSFNNIDNSGNWTIKAKEIYGDNLLVNSNVDITGNLDLSCNLILDVSGIYFCDGTYIGQGNSFDISANQVLVLTGVQDPSGNYNGASIVSNDRVFQQLNPDPSWNDVNGYYGLSKDAYPALNPYSSGIQAVSDWTPRTAPEGGWISVCWSPELKLFVAVAYDGPDRVMTSPDGINWTPRIAPNDNIWYSICWSPELGIFVAVAYGGSSDRVMTSPDGINWTSRTVPGEEWLSVCWSAELGIFVAVAYGGSSDRVMTSPDGINWTPRTSANDSEWYSVCWSPELGLFVVVAYDGPETNKRVMTSPDGINWTLRTTPNNNQLQSVCWSPELGIFVAVCGSGSLDRVITSPDGINWTSRTTPNDNIWFSVCWSAELGLFVAVSDGSLLSFDDVMTSPDGINWTSRTTPNNNNWIGICWSPELGLFVSVAYDGSLDRVMTSSLQGRPPTSYNVFDSSFNNIDNSGNWTIKAKEIYGDNLLVNSNVDITGNLDLNCNLLNDVSGINFCDGTYIGEGNSFDISANQVLVLTGVQDPSGNYNGASIVSNDRVFQQLNPDPSWNDVNGYYGLSKDAYPALNPYSSGVQAVSTWNVRTAAANNNWRSICWSAELGIFVAVSDDGSGNRVMTSPDGINWTSQTSAANNDWRYVVWSPELGIFVAVSFDGSGNRVMTSSDGITWTSQTSAVDNNWLGLCWSPELSLFVAVADSGGTDRVMTSSNGINWFSQTTPNQDFTSVCWSPELGLFVAVARSGTGNRVMTSPDGINWTSRITPVDNNWRSVCWSPELGLFVAVPQQGGGSVVMTSTDGINWILRPSSTADESWFQVIWAAELGLFVAVATTGGSDRIMTSPDGINWTLRPSGFGIWSSICWSPELGILVAVAFGVASGTTRVITSSLAGRPPTSYNVFDSSFNRIDEQGIWTYGKRVKQELNPDPSWNAVNGYYGLAKDAYPALNPYSSGEKAVSTWTARTTPPSIANPSISNNWASVVWSPELSLFVAVAVSGTLDRVMTSPDGIVWTTQTTNNNNWTDVCWSPELGIFVAVANAGSLDRVMTSPDGITWTTTPTGIFLTNCNNGSGNIITCDDTTGLTVGMSLDISSGLGTIPPSTTIASIIDLTSFTTNNIITDLSNTIINANNNWRCVCWSPELGIFVAVAVSGTKNRVMTSPDGITWTYQFNPVDINYQSICWSPELSLFVVVSNSGSTNRVMTSPDGINWTNRTTTANDFSDVCWSPELGIFVATSFTGSLVMTSPDGIIWTDKPTPSNSWGSICWSPELGLFVAVAVDNFLNSLVMTSPNGINWTRRPSNNNRWRAVCWSPELGIFVAVSVTGSLDRVMTSSLQGRPPTSYNVFDSSFNNIDNSGNWTFKAKSIFSDQDITIDPSNTLIINGNLEVNELTTIKDDLVFVNNGNNVMSFSDFSSNTQNVQLPSIHSQPVSLTRVSLFYNDVSYNLSGTLGASVEVPFGQIIKNQLNLDISGNIISPSLDISGQYVELYVNVEINVGNNTAFQLDISGVDCTFFEIIDNIETTKSGTYYVTFGPHIFIPEQWENCGQFIFKFVNGRNQVINIQKTKIVFKSYYL
jgi:hypothetical protein